MEFVRCGSRSLHLGDQYRRDVERGLGRWSWSRRRCGGWRGLEEAHRCGRCLDVDFVVASIGFGIGQCGLGGRQMSWI